MDDIDRKIIAHIQQDGRASYADIGTAAGLSVSAVNERLKKLQANGVIQGWGARLSPKAAGLDVLAFVEVLLDRPAHDAPFRDAMRATPAVQECHHVTGDWSYLLKVRVADTEALERFLSDRLKALPGVVRSHTVIALSSVKETPILPIASD
ncbi:Lrp/AsnC family transcriptional regulator [Azospirillum brasilense]|uniref:Lrp/AsnC family transcriptional regulator n=1 Tax=Azospirillum brasilense TaxID=192 RepID=UPI001EDB4994|nr:Lrp/AsnC family transcriptional regulator [Azospirillum brasilense]UKJ72497.1 Lrp/AsnC family transcriptional regulator [Azospirillum brasilense]